MERVWTVVRHEPLVHFLILATLLFVLDAVFSSTQKDRIVVDQQTIAHLIQQREDLLLRKVSAAERRAAVAAFVEDEILYSEAYKRGLDKSDSRMRRNLILEMRGLLVGDLGKPTTEQLRSFFDENRDRFVYPATWSLEQVYFSDPRTVPPSLRDELRSGRDPTSVGETLLAMGRRLPQRSQREIAGSFGAEAARAILAIQDDQWHGPFESPQGVHFVRIVDREPPRTATYDDVKDYLQGEWMMVQSRKAIGQEIQRLRGNYDIIIEETEDVTR